MGYASAGTRDRDGVEREGEKKREGERGSEGEGGVREKERGRMHIYLRV